LAGKKWSKEGREKLFQFFNNKNLTVKDGTREGLQDFFIKPENKKTKNNLGGSNEPRNPQNNIGGVGALAPQFVPQDNLKPNVFLMSLLPIEEMNLDKTYTLEDFNLNNESGELRRIVVSMIKKAGGWKTNVWANVITPYLQNLPNQIKSLVLAHQDSNLLKKNLKNEPNYVFNEGALRVSLYGEYWFNFENIVKVEYLSGFETGDFKTTGTYESNFSSQIKSEIWRKISSGVIANMEIGKPLLCRLKKYTKFANLEAAEKLDLPLYDEYFFIYKLSSEAALDYMPTGLTTALQPGAFIPTTTMAETVTEAVLAGGPPSSGVPGTPGGPGDQSGPQF